MRTIAVLLLLLLVAVACGGRDRQLRRVTVVAAVSEALELADGQLRIRYNPPQCACAPFEIHTAQGWARADFTEADEEQDLDALLAKAEADGARGALAEYFVHASLVTSAPSYCQNRVPYVTLSLDKE